MHENGKRRQKVSRSDSGKSAKKRREGEPAKKPTKVRPNKEEMRQPREIDTRSPLELQHSSCPAISIGPIGRVGRDVVIHSPPGFRSVEVLGEASIPFLDPNRSGAQAVVPFLEHAGRPSSYFKKRDLCVKIVRDFAPNNACNAQVIIATYSDFAMHTNSFPKHLNLISVLYSELIN